MCLRSSKDRIQASGAWDMGSIPIGGTTLRNSEECHPKPLAKGGNSHLFKKY